MRRFEENIKLRRLQMATGGTYVEETEEQREAGRIAALKAEVIHDGAAILHADEKRLQLFRHKPGMLDTLKDEDGSREQELHEQRLALKRQAEEMERTYWAKKENSIVGKMVRKKLGMRGFAQLSDDEGATHGDEPMFNADRAVGAGGAVGKKKKRVTIAEDALDEAEHGPSQAHLLPTDGQESPRVPAQGARAR